MKFQQRLAQIADASREPSVTQLCFLADLNATEREQLKELWPGMAVERRRKLARELVELAEDNVEFDFSAVFFNALGDSDDEVRAVAIDGLWENEERVVLHRLFDIMCADPSARVRAAAVTSLARFTYKAEIGELDGRWVNKLKQALIELFYRAGEVPEVRRRAVEAVAYFGEDESVARVISEAYSTNDRNMKASAVHAMGHSLRTEWVETIIKEFSSPHAEMRFEAARASGEIGDRRAVLPLIELVGDGDPEVRLAAIAALGQLGGKQAEDVLARCCQSRDSATSEAAQDALEELRFNRDPLDVLGGHLH